ncbi:hypothetical protein LEP1GSC062_1922 [Leptospira alexanderi serovar Manhao 3 str. L 60]|uniref:Uncharacterized protein n=1 Tax=Leptospira alexanderi serovar Manhao 3 str. L 60 TaxID=1049759 RepID=V6I673_9LEPT|nr:hypothetical protein LEP1GSC062_1922 [Leptospira alexanderi serovar Manhao 3 str. L 60]
MTRIPKTIISAYCNTIEILYSMIHAETLGFHTRIKFENFPLRSYTKNKVRIPIP